MKATIFHSVLSVKSLTFILFHSIAMCYWHFMISYHDKWNFSVCYRTVLPLSDISKYFAIIKWKGIFPISHILTLGGATQIGSFLFFFMPPKVTKASIVVMVTWLSLDCCMSLILTVLLSNFANVNDPLRKVTQES